MTLAIILLFLSVPSGLLVAWLARDELIDGRRYLKCLFVLSFCLLFFFLNYEDIVVSLGFIAISTWISLLKSYDSKWAVVRKT